METRRHRARTAVAALGRVLGGEAGGGIVLIVVATLAMAVANSPLHARYEALLHARLRWTPMPLLDSAHLWINDGLMTVFFLVVGLEIKREVVAGDLAEPRRRRLPVIAAAAGMAVPALCFLAVAGSAPALQRGWAIPGATDIAFAVGVVALLGRRVPPSLRLFLLTVAIVDDLGAVAIIALFYTAAVSPGWLLAAAVVWAAMLALARLRVDHAWPFLVLALLLWLCVLHSGVHATVAGVLAGMAMPMASGAGEKDAGVLPRVEHALQPWVTYLVLPLFGFANAGVVLSGGATSLAAPLPLGIAVGLFAGKQAGVLGAVAAAERLGIAARPEGASWPQVWGAALLCGIGFTMSLFIAGLAFGDQPGLFEEAKLGVVSGSLLSIVAGYAVLRVAHRRGAKA